MILDFLDGDLDGDSWEELCQHCYRMRYQNEHYTEIPAVQGGDAGIEGFTVTGVVNQCYCPERSYSENELYEHLREKMTKDLNKLVSTNYSKRLLALGVPTIKEWHFVIPHYKDARIIEHANNKRKEILAKKKAKPNEYAYIDDNFKIIIKQAEDFRLEITKIIRESLTDTKLNLALRKIDATDWSSCESEKVENIIRKVKAVMGEDFEDDEDFKDLIDTYVAAYIKGLEILRTLRISYTEMYEDVYSLEQSYKKQVAIKTMMNGDKSLNYKIFNDILDDFELKLREACKYFSMDSIIELKIDIISMWLADCSMKFRR